MDRYVSGKTVGILGIIGNIFLLIIKAFAGFFSNSQSLIADAFNSAGDIFSSIMTFVGNKISSKDADNNHHFGYGKAEYIYSLLISISMFIFSYEVIKSVILHIIQGITIEYSIWFHIHLCMDSPNRSI